MLFVVSNPSSFVNTICEKVLFDANNQTNMIKCQAEDLSLVGLNQASIHLSKTQLQFSKQNNLVSSNNNRVQ